MKTKRARSRCFLFCMVFCALFSFSPVVLAQDSTKISEADAEVEAGPLKLDPLGLYLNREEGGFINLRIVEGQFQLYFLDASQNVEDPTYSTAIVNYLSLVKRSDRDRNIKLTQVSGEQFLTAVRKIAMPHNYRVRVTLKNKVSTGEGKLFVGSGRLNQLRPAVAPESEAAAE